MKEREERQSPVLYKKGGVVAEEFKAYCISARVLRLGEKPVCLPVSWDGKINLVSIKLPGWVGVVHHDAELSVPEGHESYNGICIEHSETGGLFFIPHILVPQELKLKTE